jgi:hypothetical protein
MRLGHDLGSLNRPAQRRTEACVNSLGGEGISGRFGLANPQSCEWWIEPPALKERRVCQIGLCGRMAK